MRWSSWHNSLIECGSAPCRLDATLVFILNARAGSSRHFFSFPCAERPNWTPAFFKIEGGVTAPLCDSSSGSEVTVATVRAFFSAIFESRSSLNRFTSALSKGLSLLYSLASYLPGWIFTPLGVRSSSFPVGVRFCLCLGFFWTADTCREG